MSKIRKEQRKSLLFRELAKCISELSADNPQISKVYPTRVDLSEGEGMCYVYFASTEGRELFEEVLDTLKLYRPSLKRAVARALQSRHTPDLLFVYDESIEKEVKLNKLFEKAKEDFDDSDQ